MASGRLEGMAELLEGSESLLQIDAPMPIQTPLGCLSVVYFRIHTRLNLLICLYYS